MRLSHLFSVSLSSKLLIVFVSSILTNALHAQEVLDITRVTKVPIEGTVSPKQELFNKAISEVTLEHVTGIIGEDKTKRNLTTIQNRIIADSGKFVLSIRGDSLVKKGSDYEMAVAMKVSLKGLRYMLLEQGLLYKTEGPPKILPVVQFTDRVGALSYGWWHESANTQNKFLADQADLLHKNLREEFKKIGFFSLDPDAGRFSSSLPESFRNENLTRADYLFMGEYFKSSVVLRGAVVFRNKPDSENIYRIEVRLEAWHSANGRMMAEVVRTFDTEPGAYRAAIQKQFATVSGRVAEDLGLQLAEAWKRGTFGASLLRLAVVGRVTPKMLEEFKKDVVLKVRDIKSLRERMIEANSTTFEVDSSALPQELAESIKAAAFTRFKVDVEDVSTTGLTIKVQSL